MGGGGARQREVKDDFTRNVTEPNKRGVWLRVQVPTGEDALRSRSIWNALMEGV